MKSKLRWVLLGLLGVSLLLVIGAAVLLPRLVDAESYRGLLRSNLERQLGREVDFGAMDLSLWPVLGLRLDDLVIGRTQAERFDKPIVAQSLRVGARLFPLLRGRLEVTSLIVEGPVLTFYRRDDGTWEPALTVGGDATTPAGSDSADKKTEPAQTTTGAPPLVIERLRVTRGRVVLRRDDAAGLRETTLDDLALRLDGLGTRGPVSFELSTETGGSGVLRGNGELQPADDAAGRPLRLSARVELSKMAPSALREWLVALAPTVTLPEDLLIDRPFSSSATIDYTGSGPARLVVTDAVVHDLGLLLIRTGSGAWNFESLADLTDAGAQVEGPNELAVQLSKVTIENTSIRVEDRSSPGESVAIELSPLRVEVRQPRPDALIEIDLDATGGIEGRAALQGRWSYEPAEDGRPARVRGKLEATGIDPRDLRLATTLASFPAGLVVGRLFGLSAEIDATLAEPTDVALRNVILSDLDLALERDAAGRWSLAGTAAGGTSSASAHHPSKRLPASEPESGSARTSASQFHAERIELTNASLRVTDRAAAGGPAVLNLGALRISLDRLPTAGVAALELDAQVGSGRDGKLAVRGTLGPLGDDPASMPLDLTLKLGAIPLGDAGFLLPVMKNLDVSKATAAADLRLSGSLARRLDVRGELSLAKATVSFASPRGDARTLPFDLRVRGDVGLRDSATWIELPKLELELPREDANRTLTLRGSVNAASDPPLIDIELLPTRVAADDLAALAALFAPEAPLSFASPDPVELELRARGPVGGESLPDLEGRATLSGFTFRFAGMTQPMEQVGAKVTFSPNQITLDGLGGVIGKSDVTASRVVVKDFESPRVQLDLKSRNADFWELFSFVESDGESADPTPAVEDDPLSRLTIDGTLRIERGSLQTLVFENLTTGMDFRGNVLTLAPLEMSLYGGRFSGKLVQDLNAGVLTINGNGAGVDADGFLAQNLSLGGLISGRASTELNVQVRAADPANVLAGVSGGGPLQLVDGRLAKLDVLKSLSKVTGIFGERSLQRLTRQLATAGTPFRRAETRLSFDSGTLAFEDLVIETAELTLAGRAALESATGKLDGRFAVAFSPELSATMREEQSRAADLFWDPKSQRVNFGFGVGGLATAPKVSVDWDSAIRGVAERKLGEQLRGLLDRNKPGEGGSKPATGPPSIDGSEAPGPAAASSAAGTADAGIAASDSAAAGPQPRTSGTAPSTPGLVAEITRTSWTGQMLLPDLSLEGNVRGAGIERASLAVVDARGIEVQKFDRLRPVEDQLATVKDRDAEATFSWRAEVDGKRLLVARFPVKVTVTVYDRQGGSATATREVDR